MAGLTHLETDIICRAERACLRVLEGGCSVPVGMTSFYDKETKRLSITGTVTSLSGTSHVECLMEEDVASVKEAEAVGTKLAEKLKERGATAILEEIEKSKQAKVTVANS